MDRLLIAVLALLMAAWVWLCSAHTFVSVGDEAIYLYDGWLVAQGHLPYRDFFLAHPPLRVLLSAALFAVGLPAVAGKWLAIVATGLNTALIAGLARKASGPWAAIAAAMLWMGGALSLETGAYYLGSNVATSFMLGACLAAAHGRWAWSGAILGLGAHQALYALLPGPVLLWWAWRQGRALRFVAGGMTWPAGVALAWLLFGEAYGLQTVAYHLRKVAQSPKPWPIHRIIGFLRADWAAVAFGLAAWLGRGASSRRLAALAWQSLLVVCLYRSLQSYYFTLPLALLCAAGGVGAVALTRLAAHRFGGPTARTHVAACLTFVLVWSLSALPNLHAAVARRSFQPVVDAELTQLGQQILARPPASGLLWGDTSVTPALALRTGLPIAARFVDTNDQRFDAGLTTPQTVITTVLARHRPGVLMVAHHGVYRVAPLRRHVEQHFLAQFIFQGRAMGYDVVCLLPGDANTKTRPNP